MSSAWNQDNQYIIRENASMWLESSIQIYTLNDEVTNEL